MRNLGFDKLSPNGFFVKLLLGHYTRGNGKWDSLIRIGYTAEGIPASGIVPRGPCVRRRSGGRKARAHDFC